MQPYTGEVKHLDEKKVEKNWYLLPNVGDEVMVVWNRRLQGGSFRKTQHPYRVLEHMEGTPGEIRLQAMSVDPSCNPNVK